MPRIRLHPGSGNRAGKLSPERLADLSDETPHPETTPDWAPHHELWLRIKKALFALPSSFDMGTTFPVIPASDLHSANTLLGSAIERHITVALNLLRPSWDPSGEYQDYSFKRQPQTFPDVSFQREDASGPTTLFGIEIKGWYILSKEMEPSLRLYVNKNYCHPADLCVVYPWALSAGVSGSPRLFPPLVIGARKAARIRNESWIAKAQDRTAWKEIVSPTGTPFFHPKKRDHINDSSPIDKGHNFGRFARSGIWDTAIERLLNEEEIAGIPLRAWLTFLSAFKEGSSLDSSIESIRSLSANFQTGGTTCSAAALEKVAEGLSDLVGLLSEPTH